MCSVLVHKLNISEMPVFRKCLDFRKSYTDGSVYNSIGKNKIVRIFPSISGFFDDTDWHLWHGK